MEILITVETAEQTQIKLFIEIYENYHQVHTYKENE